MSRTFFIYNADGHKIAEQHRDDDAIGPALLHGHYARVVEIDGEKLAPKSRVTLGPNSPAPSDDELETEEEFKARRAAAKAEREARKAEREADKPQAEQPAAEMQPEPAAVVEITPTPDNPA